MKFGPRKSAEIAAKAIELKKEGYTWPEIGKKLRVKKDWLKHWVDKAGYQRLSGSNCKTSPENLLKARALRKAGVSWKQVEREMGITWRTLQYAISVEDRAAKLKADATSGAE